MVSKCNQVRTFAWHLVSSACWMIWGAVATASGNYNGVPEHVDTGLRPAEVVLSKQVG